MHFSLLAGTVMAAAATVGAQQQSICDKYTTALLKTNNATNQYTLLTLLVNTAGIGNFTGPGTTHPELPGSMVSVPGILAPGMAEGEQVNLLPYFSGALMSSNRNGMPTSVNFIDGGGAKAIIANPTSPGAAGSNQAKLFIHLYQFFGALLGCSGYGQMGFPAYSGAASMQSVHQYMNLDHAQITYFIQQVGLAAKSFGATDADVTTVGMSLNNAFNYRCSPPANVIPGQGMQLQSICQNSTCPLDPHATCAAYPNGGSVSMPAPASTSMSMGMGMGAMGSTSAVSQQGDHQPTAATSAVSQISDHQPQAMPTAASAPMTPAATPAKYTGAAAAVNALPAMAVGAAGLAAVLL